jgi:hypothetical protein
LPRALVVKKDWVVDGLVVVGMLGEVGMEQFVLGMAHGQKADMIEVLRWPVIANMESDVEVAKTPTLEMHMVHWASAQELRV